MPEATETGLKWWMRYVIVPIIGGGGVIAIVVAYMALPPKPIVSQPDPVKVESTKPAPMSTQTSEPKVQTSSKRRVTAQPEVKHQIIEKPADAPVKPAPEIPKPPDYEPDLSSVKFYIYDRTNHTDCTGEGAAEFPRDEKFSVKWEAKSLALHGEVGVFYAQDSDPPKQIGYGTHEGSHDFTCRGKDMAVIDFELTLTPEGGKKRTLKKIQVVCDGS